MADNNQSQSGTSSQTEPAVIDLRNTGSKAAATQSIQTTGEQEGIHFVTHKNKKYPIPKLVQEKFPDLIELIKITESMNDEEREYWYQILPIMTEPQITKFRGILVHEKEQLAKLDKQYQDELNKLNDKHLVEWKAFESKKQKAKIHAAESKSKNEEIAEEEELLKRLSEV